MRRAVVEADIPVGLQVFQDGGQHVVRSTEAIGAYALDAEGRVLLTSPVAEDLSGYALYQVRNHHYLEYVPAELAPEVTDHFRRAMSGERVEGEVEIVTAAGAKVHVGFTAQPDHDSSGTVIGVTGTVWLDD